jgi:Peptidase family M23
MLRPLALGIVILAALAPPARAWQRPVAGPVTRAFSYSAREPFRRGWHRGVALAARPGAPVRAVCSGQVVTATWGVVTLRCGPWRVTHLPLGSVAVRRGAVVREGAVVGALASGRRALYISIRRDDNRFAYVDPLRFLPGSTRHPPLPFLVRRFPSPITARRLPAPVGAVREPAPVGARRVPAPVGAVREPAPIGVRGPRGAPVLRPRVVPSAASPVARVRVPGRRPLAPWPVWLGLALVVAGALGGGITVRVRRGRLAPEPVASAP